jgi:hypothetical protein
MLTYADSRSPATALQALLDACLLFRSVTTSTPTCSLGACMAYVVLLLKKALSKKKRATYALLCYVCCAVLRMQLVCRRLLAHITHLHGCETYADVC